MRYLLSPQKQGQSLFSRNMTFTHNLTEYFPQNHAGLVAFVVCAADDVVLDVNRNGET